LPRTSTAVVSLPDDRKGKSSYSLLVLVYLFAFQTTISSATLNYISIKLIFPQHSQKWKPISLLCVTDLSACVSEALCNLKETSTTTVYASYCCHYVVLKDIFKTIFLLMDISSHSFIAIMDIVYFNKQL